MRYHPRNHARVAPERLAYIIPADDVAVTYGQLEAEANQLARVFRALGLRIGSGVAFLLENRRGFFELCWAAQRAGLYYTPISTHLNADEIAYIVTNCEARAFVISARYSEIAARLAGQLPAATTLLSLGGAVDGYRALEPLMREASTAPIADETAGSSMLYSSGTTGYPKGIRHPLTGAAIDACPPRVERFRERYAFDNAAVYLSPAPLYMRRR